MTVLVTGSAGHLGEAIARTLHARSRRFIGLDIKASPYTHRIGSIADRGFVRDALRGVRAVVHAATLHKPHVATHPYQDFIDVNITGTLNLLEEAATAGVQSFVFTSTTSAFGSALSPAPGQEAVWVTEDIAPVAKNIYGASKVAAEDLCAVVHRKRGLPVVVLRTARFFPEADDDAAVRSRYGLLNAQANEYLYRRVDIEDVVAAHLLALDHAPRLGFRRYLISATTPFSRAHLAGLRADAPVVVGSLYPQYPALFEARGWSMFPGVDRVYVNALARRELGWAPRYDFGHVLDCLRDGRDFRSDLALAVGSKGYHDEVFADMPYPVG